MSEETEAQEEQAEEEAENKSPLDDAEHLNELYHEQELTQSEIGEKYGVSASTVSHYMKKHEVPTRGRRVLDDRLEDADWLYEQYVEEDLTMQQIADEVGCSDGTVMRRLRKHGIIEEPSHDEDEEVEEEETEDEETEDEADEDADEE